MKSKQKLLALAVGAALVSVSTVTLAQQTGKAWYGGLSIGQSSVKFADGFLPITGATATTVSKSDTDTAYKAYVGYRFNQNFALETGWTDFGRHSFTRTMTAPGAGSAMATRKVSGWHVDAVGILPVQNNFSFFAKVGGIYDQVKTSYSSTGAVVFAPGTDLNPKSTNWNWKFGLGAGYEFSQNVGLRAEWERVFRTGNDNTGKGDVDLFSVGVVFRFF